MSVDKETPKEKETQGSKEEHSEDTPSKGGGVKGSISRYVEAKDKEKPADKTGDKPEDKDDKPCKDCSATDEELEIEPEAKLWIVDAEGKKTPFVFKADGKSHTPDDPAWALQQASLGVHSNVKTEEANKVSKEFEDARPFLDALTKAAQEGKLVVDGKRLTPETAKDFQFKTGEKPEEEDEEDETVDPEVRQMKKDLKDQKKELADFKKGQLIKLIDDAKGKLFADCDSVKDKYFAAYTRLEEDGDEGPQPYRVWDILKDAKYDGKEAMKLSHESVLKHFDSLVKAHPELLDRYKDGIITDWNEKKEKKEEAPVQSPSGVETRTPLSNKGDQPKGVKARVQFFMAKQKEKETKAGQQ